LQSTDQNIYFRPIPPPASVKPESRTKQTASKLKSTAFKSPFRKTTAPCKAVDSIAKPDELETANRNLKLLIAHKENNESQKLDALIAKWKGASKDALIHLQQLIGQVIVESQPVNNKRLASNSFQESGWESEKGVKFARVFADAMMCGESSGVITLNDLVEEIESGRRKDEDDDDERTDDSRTERMMTLKEICARLMVDPGLLGKYNEENDAFEE